MHEFMIHESSLPHSYMDLFIPFSKRYKIKSISLKKMQLYFNETAERPAVGDKLMGAVFLEKEKFQFDW